MHLSKLLVCFLVILIMGCSTIGISREEISKRPVVFSYEIDLNYQEVYVRIHNCLLRYSGDISGGVYTELSFAEIFQSAIQLGMSRAYYRIKIIKITNEKSLLQLQDSGHPCAPWILGRIMGCIKASDVLNE